MLTAEASGVYIIAATPFIADGALDLAVEIVNVVAHGLAGRRTVTLRIVNHFR